MFQQIDSLNSQHSYIEKQLDSLEAASQPRKDELDRLEELKKIISIEEKEIDKLIQGSKKLKEKVVDELYYVLLSLHVACRSLHLLTEQNLVQWLHGRWFMTWHSY